MWGTAREAKIKSLVTFSYGLFHMDVPLLADQQELKYNSFIRTQDVV